MEAESTRWELTYCDEIQQIDGNILKVPPNLLSILEKEDIMVEGEAEDQCIFSAGGNSYKMRGIFLPTTMLVTPAIGTNFNKDEPNSEQKPRRPVSKVLIQTSKYLKIEPHEIQFDQIFKQISELSLDPKILQQSATLKTILDNEGISLAELKSRYRLTKSHVEKMAQIAPITFFSHEEDEEIIVIQLSNAYMVAVLKQLLLALITQNRLSRPFSYLDIPKSVPIIDLKFLEIIARHFAFQVTPSLSVPSSSCSEMEVQRTFKVTLDTLLKFLTVQMLLVNKQYTKDLIDMIMNLLIPYLPLDEPEYSEEKAKQRLPDIISEYFLEITKDFQTKYVSYNSLLLSFNVKARVQQISFYKKKFSRAELFGLFSCGYTEKEMDDILMKNFRKMGKAYEIKLIIPK